MTRMIRASLHLGVVAALLAFVAIVASAWSSQPLGMSVTRVSAAGGIVLQINSGGGTFVFSPVMCDQDNMSPSSQCATSIDISNAGDDGDVSFTYTIRAWADDDGVDTGDVGPDGDGLIACFNVNLALGVADGIDVGDSSAIGPLAGAQLAPGNLQTWGLEASVDDDNACQGATTWLIVSVTATSDDVPPIDTATPKPTSTRRPGSTSTPEPTSTRRSGSSTPAPTSTMPSGSNENNDPGYTYPDATRTPTPTPTRSAALPANPNVVAPPAVSPTAAAGGQQTPVNELPGVQRLPNTGSGGLAGGSFQFSATSSAALVLLLGVILAGSGIILTLRRHD